MPCNAVQNETPLYYPSQGVAIRYSYYTSSDNILSVYSNDSKVTGFEMFGQSHWKKLMPKGAGTYFSQSGELTGGSINTKPRIIYSQELFFEFPESDKEIGKAKKEAANCCNLVFIHFFSTGIVLVHGIEIDDTLEEGFTTNKVDSLRLTPRRRFISIEDEPPHEWNITGRALSIAPLCTMSYEDIEAL